mgnify:CR=1 FL=1
MFCWRGSRWNLLGIFYNSALKDLWDRNLNCDNENDLDLNEDVDDDTNADIWGDHGCSDLTRGYTVIAIPIIAHSEAIYFREIKFL